MKEDPSREEALVELLTSLFDVNSLIRWVRLHLGQIVHDELPNDTSSLANIAFQTVLSVGKHGKATAAMFASLAKLRPNRANEIWIIASLWGVSRSENYPIDESLDRERRRLARTIFASYSSPDAAVAESALSLIGVTGAASIRTQQHLSPGDDVRLALSREIARAETVLVFWSRNAADSQSIAWQLAEAVAGGKRVIPVLLDNTPRCQGLRDLSSIDLRRAARRLHSASVFGEFSVALLAAVLTAAAVSTVWIGGHSGTTAVRWTLVLACSVLAWVGVRHALTRRLRLGGDSDERKAVGTEAERNRIARSFLQQFSDVT